MPTMPAKEQIKAALLNRDSFATTLITIFIDLYGTEGISWSPAAIRMELEDDFSIKLPSVIFHRLMTAIYLLTSNSFYVSLPDFIEICNNLSGSPSTLGEFAPADAADCAWGITEAMLLSPPEEGNDNPFSPEIAGYIGYTVREEGILNPPDILRIGTRDEDDLKKVQYGFSDDPTMFSAIWGTEKSKTDDINDLVRARLTEMMRQLKTLPLVTGSTEQIVERMLRNLNGAQTQSSVL